MRKKGEQIMAKVFAQRIMIAIDVGTTKICVLVAQMEKDCIELLGVGKAPSDGLKKGVVVDINKTIQSIKTAAQEAQIMSGVSIENAVIGISGGHIHSTNSSGVVPTKHGQVSAQDVQAVLAAAKAIPVAEGQQILHVLPQYFILDGHHKVTNPVGMHAVRLEVQAHIIMGSIASVQNLITCTEMAGIKVHDIILEQLASAHAVLSPDEREIGAAILDIGGGTCDFAIYQQGNIRHTMVLPIAGNHFTHDLAIGLHTTLADAERIKKEYGSVLFDLVDKDQIIEVDCVQGNEKNIIHSTDIVHILSARAHEIAWLVQEEIYKQNLLPFMPAGVVLTGGGSLLKGFAVLAHDIFNMPVRIGKPHSMYNLPQSLDSPIYATAYGLLLYMHKERQMLLAQSQNGPLATRVFSRMKSWVSDFF
jgi:cell division protein FtsA